jgi:Uma2 family endonuclease
MAKPAFPNLVPEDLLDLPLPEGVSGYELVDGVPVPVGPASFTHGELIIEVGYRLRRHIDGQGVAGRVVSDAGFVLGLARDPTRLRGPDVAFVSEAKLREHFDPERDFGRFGRFVPDLAVEIDLSGGRKPGGRQRIREYLEAGVPLVWVIEPSTRSATVYRRDGSTVELSAHDALEGEDIVPDFRLPLSTLFR